MNTKPGLTGRVAGAAARRPWWTLGIWALLIAGAFMMAGRLGDVVTDGQELSVATEAQRGQDLIDEHLAGNGDDLQELILIESFTTVDDPGFAAETERIVGELRGMDTVVSAVSYLDGVPGLVSADRQSALVVATMAEGEAIDNSAPVVELVREADASGRFTVSVLGEGSIGTEFERLAEETLRGGETLGIAVAIVILVLVFGAAVAAGIPLLLALMSIVLALALTAVVGQVLELSMFVTNMIVMIGLAVGIDYTLFVVQRYREERALGADVGDAVVRAADTATRAVVFSGMTVVIGLSGLMIMPDTVMRSLGMGAILAVIAAGLAAVTLLPAALRLLGDRIDRLRVPFAAKTHYHEGGGRFWHRVTRVVTARPVVSVVLAVGVLLAAAAPYLTIRTGSNFIDSLPADSPSVYAFDRLNEEFDTGVITSPIVVAAGDVSDPGVAAAVADLQGSLEADPAYGEIAVVTAPSGEVVVLDAVSKLDPSTIEAREALAALRTETIPAAFAGVDAEVLVTGQAAFTADYVEIVAARSPIIFGFVLGMSFLLLMMVFRSIVVPLKAILMNLLSVGAAYGLLVLVFQHGVGAGVLGLHQTDVIEAWVPLFLFTVLFGLSMDYHIFLLSRIKENYDQTGDNAGSVAFGLGSTGAIITGAALIMVAVFGGFALGDLVMFQQMGFGLAVAVVLDATLIRSVLVPATMSLLGDLNWYLPKWLHWLPRIEIEGRRPLPRDLVPEPALERAA